ncbi:MAG: hypothetical protein CMJ18_16935 [Phycisphaeraceae bacterium]|nr:hypothetical protein [Phycisphaeraceae bacterium]
MQSLQGRILVSSPHLLDPNFFQTAVLLVHHTDDGALGLILNRPTEVPVGDAWEKISETPCHRSGTLFHGGPCDGPMMVLHRHESVGEIEMLPGIHFSAEQEHVAWLIEQDGDSSRFFVGNSGWAPGQLEQELETGAWIVIDGTSEHVFCDADRWIEVLERIARMTTKDASSN